jgi:hypothetical protein
MNRPRLSAAPRVAGVLGVEEERAQALLAAMRARVGRARYSVRVAAFLVTTGPGARLLPRSLRRRGARALVGCAVPLPADAMFYLGETDTLAGDSCRGLLRR